MPIYGFVTDEAMLDTTTSLVQVSAINKGVGYMDDQMENYFSTHGISRDVRSSRLAIASSKALRGNMALHLDFDQWLPNAGIAITDVSVNNWTSIFNIVEKIAYSEWTSESRLESDLAGGAAYAGYIANSKSYSDEVIQVVDVKVEGSTPTLSKLNVREWVGFKLNISNITVEFKIWLGMSAFKTEYPISLITKVICPCDPAKLVTADFDNIMDALSESALYANQEYQTEITRTEHSGMMPYSVEYFNSQFSTPYQMSFGIMFRGANPSSEQAKTAIREYLNSLTAIASTEVWKQLFPGLYIGATFFLVPLYDEQISMPTRDISKGIVNLSPIGNKIVARYPNYDSAKLLSVIQLLSSDADPVLICAFPASNNTESYQSLFLLHPTYQPVDGTDPAFEYQDASTQEFNEKLSKVLTYALNKTLDRPTWASAVSLDGKEYLLFTISGVDYYMLLKASY